MTQSITRATCIRPVLSDLLDQLNAVDDSLEHLSTLYNIHENSQEAQDSRSVHRSVDYVRAYVRKLRTSNDTVLRPLETAPDNEHGPDALIAACNEKLKAGLVRLEPGESYSITVTKEVEAVTVDISPQEFGKRFAQSYQG